MTMVDRLQHRSSGLPGMGCFYGPSGFGKSMAGIYCANQLDAVLVQCESVWSQKALCEAIIRELGLTPERVVYRMVAQIQQALAVRNAPLIIDEADFLVKKKMVEVLRDIYEKSFVPVILIGEEALPSKLREWERINSRMLERVAAQPIDDNDFDALARIRAPKIVLGDALKASIKQASQGSARLIVNNLDTVRIEAQRRGLSAIDLADLKGDRLHDGKPPQMRRFG
ncbi:AAA family ATPase [Litorisediminicola beolgyonensis]|uniref:AAA family ATPase n=2 Tax=Litorisediminicola beolgyonensis TaxID=1173614 RepID=A0ABW3ZIS3_9RHOB